MSSAPIAGPWLRIERNLLPVLLAASLGGLWTCAREEAVRPAESTAGEEVAVVADLDLERTIAPGESHRYRLAAGESLFVHLVVEQRGIDLGTVVRDREGTEILTADRPIADTGPEPLLLLTEAGESYTFEVSPWSATGPPGRYRIVVRELHAATRRDRSRVRAAAVFAAAETHRRDRRPAEAAELYDVALGLWRHIGDPFWEAETLDRRGKAYRSLGDLGRSADDHRACVEAARRASDAQLEAMGLTQAGTALFDLGEFDRAIRLWNQALPLYGQVGDRAGQGIVLHDLAHAAQIQNRVYDSIDRYLQALSLWDDSDLANRAHSLHNLGVLNFRLGRSQRALDYLEEALANWEALGDGQRLRQAATLSRTAEVYLAMGRVDEAEELYRRALSLRRLEDDRRGEAAALTGLARVYQQRGAGDEALARYEEALVALGELDRPRSRARIELGLGRLYNSLERFDAAIAAFGAALPAFHRSGDRIDEAECLLGISVANRRQGDSRAALERAGPALDLLESVRPLAMSEALRADFFATVQHHYEFYIDLLMELQATDPDGGYLERALYTSDRSRARSMVDLLNESGVEIRRGADADLLSRERDLQQRINDRESERLGLLAEEDGEASNRRFLDDQVAAIEHRLRDLLEELERARAEIRADSPRYAALAPPVPLDLDQIRRQVLDPDTLLLEYRLGEARSYLWLVSDRTVSGFELPPREQVETAARQAYELMQRSLRREGLPRAQLALCELSRQVLGPVADRLDRERLLIVSDGALDYIPFAALPDPSSLGRCQEASPLIEQHEITYLPSALAMAVLRRSRATRPAPAGALAVVADPVFTASDPRLTGGPPLSGAQPAGRRSAVERQPFRRLPASRREADAIVALVPKKERSRVLVGLEANKDAVVGGALTGYGVVHFATHGVIDASQPELSGIALSMVDGEGRPRDGFLRAHEIYNLDLPSELVVLSACRTALGRQVRGEGLMGLTRALMYAGANRVMVSLWNVGDANTAVLMEEFYRGLFERGLPASTALRRAQLEMLHDDARSAPFHWAGFILQGEWR